MVSVDISGPKYTSRGLKAHLVFWPVIRNITGGSNPIWIVFVSCIGVLWLSWLNGLGDGAHLYIKYLHMGGRKLARCLLALFLFLSYMDPEVHAVRLTATVTFIAPETSCHVPAEPAFATCCFSTL